MYRENKCVAIGMMEQIIEGRGGTFVAQTSAEGYTFEASRALRGDIFAGLPLDQENQARLTADRIKKWVDQLKKEFEQEECFSVLVFSGYFQRLQN